MAKKFMTAVELTDDLDGGKADQTIEFTSDGVSYEMDLSKKNGAVFQKLMKPYVDVSRRAKEASRTTSARSTPRASRSDLPAAREWANGNGHPVSDPGRIPAAVLEAYDAAH